MHLQLRSVKEEIREKTKKLFTKPITDYTEDSLDILERRAKEAAKKKGVPEKPVTAPISAPAKTTIFSPTAQPASQKKVKKFRKVYSHEYRQLPLFANLRVRPKRQFMTFRPSFPKYASPAQLSLDFNKRAENAVLNVDLTREEILKLPISYHFRSWYTYSTDGSVPRLRAAFSENKINTYGDLMNLLGTFAPTKRQWDDLIFRLNQNITARQKLGFNCSENLLRMLRTKKLIAREFVE